MNEYDNSYRENIEDIGRDDDDRHQLPSRTSWHLFTPEQQIALNALASADQQAAYKELVMATPSWKIRATDPQAR